jgi:hypothetical protein
MARTDRPDRHGFLLYGKAVRLLTPCPEHVSPLAISLASSGCIAVRAASRIDVPLVELGHNLIVARDARAHDLLNDRGGPWLQTAARSPWLLLAGSQGVYLKAAAAAHPRVVG